MALHFWEVGSGGGKTGWEDSLRLAEGGVSLPLWLLCALRVFVSPSVLSGPGPSFLFHHECSVASNTSQAPF